VRAAIPWAAFLEACQLGETAADAVIDGLPCGAFSHFAIGALSDPALSGLGAVQLIAAVGDALRQAGYDQLPTVAGPPELLTLPILARAPGS